MDLPARRLLANPGSETRLRHLNEMLFHGLDYARAIVADWVADYNAERQHSALG